MAEAKISGSLYFDWAKARSEWASKNIHPHYGPCDAFADGDCAECQRQWEHTNSYVVELEERLKMAAFLLEDFCSVIDEAAENNLWVEQVDDGQLDALYDFYAELSDFMKGD